MTMYEEKLTHLTWPCSGYYSKTVRRRDFLTKGMTFAATLSLPFASVSGAIGHAFQLAPESILPEGLRYAPAKIREAYRFAVANRPVLRYIPCYCNCGETAGHTSNASCYVKDASPV